MSLWLFAFVYACETAIRTPRPWGGVSYDAIFWNIIDPSNAGWWLTSSKWVLFPLGMFALGVIGGVYRNRNAKALVVDHFKVKITPADHHLRRRVEFLAHKLGLEPPDVGTMSHANAFAVGASSKDAMVVLGLPLVTLLRPEELDAVIGHELGHIATNDMQRMQVGEGYKDIICGVVGFFGNAIARSLDDRNNRAIAASLTALLQMTLFAGSELVLKRMSRTREYYADAIGAALTSRQAMGNALRRIHDETRGYEEVEQTFGSMMFRADGGSLLATHPTLESRLNALKGDAYVKRLDGGSKLKSVLGTVMRTSQPHAAQAAKAGAALAYRKRGYLTKLAVALLCIWGAAQVALFVIDAHQRCRFNDWCLNGAGRDTMQMLTGLTAPPYKVAAKVYDGFGNYQHEVETWFFVMESDGCESLIMMRGLYRFPSGNERWDPQWFHNWLDMTKASGVEFFHVAQEDEELMRKHARERGENSGRRAEVRMIQAAVLGDGAVCHTWGEFPKCAPGQKSLTHRFRAVADDGTREALMREGFKKVKARCGSSPAGAEAFWPGGASPILPVGTGAPHRASEANPPSPAAPSSPRPLSSDEPAALAVGQGFGQALGLGNRSATGR